MRSTILIADDSASDRMIIKNMLGDYNVLTANDGIEVMRQLEEHPDIHLLILDLKMPNMDGFAVLEALKSDARYKNLRTIILTNYDEIDNEIKGLNLGAVDYIRKPIHMDSLKARIDVHAALLRAECALAQKLNEQTLSFEVVFEQSPIGIAISQSNDPESSDGTFIKINAMFERITGRSKEDIVNSGWAAMTHPDDLKKDMENFRKLQAGEFNSYSMEKRLIKPDGSIVWVFMTVAALARQGESAYNFMCLIQDISENKKNEVERKYINEHDRLTGLYNREYFDLLLKKEAEVEISKRALVGINLSTAQLLTVNYGYNYTQSLMVKVAETLSQYCTSNHMLFRTHENRFLFYVKNYTDKTELLTFADKIANALAELFATDRVGGGIGILEIKPNESNADLLSRKLLIASEKAIHVFDKEFRICFYDEALEALVNREIEIRNELARISADNEQGELYLQYQPILDLKTDTICGFEALARLKTEKLGSVSPLEFIPIAEATKLIIPIGEQVLIAAFRFLNKLTALGFSEISMAVNVSGIQLLRPGFSDRLLELVKEIQVDPKNICLEITESIFLYDFTLINGIIGKLREVGFHVAIDDFGTGYSSLAREKELNVNCLKIDKLFIDKLLDPGNNLAITGDIISIAHKLGHITVAEGVENTEQMQYLKVHGCDKIQGYLIGKPLDEEAALELLKNQPVIKNSCPQRDRQTTAKDCTYERSIVFHPDENKEQLQLILDSTVEAIFRVDLQGNCTFCNISCIKMLGYNSRSELLGKNMYLLIHHKRRDGNTLPIEACKFMIAMKQGRGIRGEDEIFLRADGTFLEVEYYAHPQIKNGEIVGAVVSFLDKSKQKQKEAEIKHLMYHDILTGLYNRRYFEEILKTIDNPENLPLSVIFADINALKITNDIFGHSAGDELIRKAAQNLQKVCRQNDIVARIGGDEFIILLPNTTAKDAERIIDSIQTVFAEARVAAVKCSFSLGMDTKSNPDQPLEMILVNAENRMYKHKTMNRKSINKDIIETIIESLHAKNPMEKQHSAAVSAYCADIGTALHLTEDEISKLKRAAYLHDIGKIVLDKNILSKADLSDEENEKMRQHAVVGYRILNLFDDTLDLADVVYGHHERWDGTGYPRGLKGKQIPLLSRIIAIAENYDAAQSRSELPLEKRKLSAIDVIKAGAGTKFDPEIAELFVHMIEQNDAV